MSMKSVKRFSWTQQHSTTQPSVQAMRQHHKVHAGHQVQGHHEVKAREQWPQCRGSLCGHHVHSFYLVYIIQKQRDPNQVWHSW